MFESMSGGLWKARLCLSALISHAMCLICFDINVAALSPLTADLDLCSAFCQAQSVAWFCSLLRPCPLSLCSGFSPFIAFYPLFVLSFETEWKSWLVQVYCATFLTPERLQVHTNTHHISVLVLEPFWKGNPGGKFPQRLLCTGSLAIPFIMILPFLKAEDSGRKSKCKCDFENFWFWVSGIAHCYCCEHTGMSGLRKEMGLFALFC